MSQGEKSRGTKEKKKIQGRFTEEMKDKTSSSSEEETGEIIEWRSMSQEEVDQGWKKLPEKIEEEVLDRYKVEDSKKRGLQRQRRHHWRRERRSKKYIMRKWEEDCWARIFALFKKYNLQRLKKHA